MCSVWPTPDTDLSGRASVGRWMDRYIDFYSAFSFSHKWNHLHSLLTILRYREIESELQDSIKMQRNDEVQIQYSGYLSWAGRVQKRLPLYWSHFIKLNGGNIGIWCVILLLYFLLFLPFCIF